MEQSKIERINQLARKSRTDRLTPEELTEQKQLRSEYLSEFRAQFSGILSHTVVEYPDGSRKKLEEFKENKNDNG